MIPELAEPGFLNASDSLTFVLIMSALLLVPWGHALLMWRRHEDRATRDALSRRGWLIACAITFGYLHLLCFGGYWLRLSVGEVVEAEVQRIEERRAGGRSPSWRTVHTLYAVSANPEQWPLQATVGHWLDKAAHERVYGPSGAAARGQRVPFVVVPFWPRMYEMGTRATVQPAEVGFAGLGIFLFLIAYIVGLFTLSPRREG